MHTEYEVRVLDIDVEDVKKRLERIGASFDSDLLQRRYVYDLIPKVEGKWLRLRTNGLTTTLTVKNVVSSEIDGTQELEVGVSDFEGTNMILRELGYKPKGYQENRRVRYEYRDVEIDIDYWPHIPTYLEIEGNSEEEVYAVLEKLGFQKEDATTRDVEGIYEDYGHPLSENYNLILEESRRLRSNKSTKERII